jgi:ABC-type transporter Mla subunit MlaD
MAFTATISGLYDAIRRRVAGDETACRATVEAIRMAHRSINGIDGKLDALSRTVDERFHALSQPFNGLKSELNKDSDAFTQAINQRLEVLSRAADQRFVAFEQTMERRLETMSQRLDGLKLPFAELSRAAQERTTAGNHSVNQRLDVLSRVIDQRFNALDQRLGAMAHSIDERLATQEQRFPEIDAKIAATKFRYQLYLGILLTLMLGLGSKVIFDWKMPATLFGGLWQY